MCEFTQVFSNTWYGRKGIDVFVTTEIQAGKYKKIQTDEPGPTWPYPVKYFVTIHPLLSRTRRREKGQQFVIFVYIYPKLHCG